MRQNIAKIILQKCVMRPSRDPLEPATGTRCFVVGNNSGAGRIESIVHSDKTPEHASQQNASLDEWRDRDKPKQLLLKFPGTAGRAERSSNFPLDLLNASYRDERISPESHAEVWVWNPPGYGQSDGRPNLFSLTAMAIDWARQVAEARCDFQTTVVICGNSLGCLPGLALGSAIDQWKPAGLPAQQVGCWLRNPPDLREVVPLVARRYYSESFMRRVLRVLPDTLDPLATAARCPLPTVYLMSELDSLCLPRLQRKIHDRHLGRHKVVPLAGLGHGGLIEKQHLRPLIPAAQWLCSQILP